MTGFKNLLSIGLMHNRLLSASKAWLQEASLQMHYVWCRLSSQVCQLNCNPGLISGDDNWSSPRSLSPESWSLIWKMIALPPHSLLLAPSCHFQPHALSRRTYLCQTDTYAFAALRPNDIVNFNWRSPPGVTNAVR